MRGLLSSKDHQNKVTKDRGLFPFFYFIHLRLGLKYSYNALRELYLPYSLVLKLKVVNFFLFCLA